MSPIAIRPENKEAGELRFRAVAGNRQSVGRTMGEALDALTADWGDDIKETAVLIQRFEPDPYFTEAQYSRMQELLARRALLTAEERTELEALIDAELEATIARTDSLVRQPPP
jgi:regulator of protease activity HflC (stomatin/prohibitin superfamily)